MSEKFLRLGSVERKEIFETLAFDLGRKANVLEKDVWVCWALEAMFSMPDALPIAFKGGTSLSKVYAAINRFSEDIDITVDYRALAAFIGDDFDPFASGQSKNQIRKYGDRLRAGLKDYAEQQIVPYLNNCVAQLPDSADFSIEQSADGEKIWVHYPSSVEEQDDYLKNSILIELGGRNVIEPSELHVVKPDIAAVLDDQALLFPEAQATHGTGGRTNFLGESHPDPRRMSTRAD